MQRPRNLLVAIVLLALVAMIPLTASAQSIDFGQPQHFRPYNQYGINVFEPLKVDTTAYNGFELYWGGAFTQQFQALDHSNTADPLMEGDENLNALENIGAGFNLATANLLLGAQLAEGIQVNLITYLSSRHHPEAWVKGGYVQADELPMLHSDAIDRIMDYVTVRLGHFEINYGDAHFRRTDNGMAMYNPFVGNYIMDSFTTEIGGEVYFQHPSGVLAMAGITGGEINGRVNQPDDRAPSFLGKVGVDRQVNERLRLRLTGSGYTTSSSVNNTLYSGDRAGSRYYDVLVHTAGDSFTNGRINPGFRDEVTAFQVNPFVEFDVSENLGFDLFGIIETASGRAGDAETEDRTWTHFAVDGVVRFLPGQQAYLGGRYNTASGEIAGSGADVSVERFAVSAGWFATPNLLLKAEYVNQQYNDFAPTNILSGGQFDGFVVEGVLAF